MRLYTFTISHFSEKVRWALDYEGIAYVEEPLLPGAHLPVIRRRAPKSTVPLLDDDGRFVQGSAAILEHVHHTRGLPRLMPMTEEETDLEARADIAFGLGTQRIFYSYLLAMPSVIIDMWAQDAPWWGRAFYRVALPALKPAIRRGYKTDPASVERAKDRWRTMITELDERLAKQRYLTNDEGPRRVDLAIAALLAPTVQPPEHVLRWPALPPETDPAFLAFLREFEDGTTWRWVQRMYREHRRPKR